MVIYRRNIQTQKAQTDVLKIIQSSAYQGNCKISTNSFSVKCPKRNQRGQLMLVPIKGQVTSCDHITKVTLELYVGIEVIIGLSVIALGLIMMLFNFILPTAGKFTSGIMTTGIGALISVFYWLRGIEAIDLLEYKIIS